MRSSISAGGKPGNPGKGGVEPGLSVIAELLCSVLGLWRLLPFAYRGSLIVVRLLSFDPAFEATFDFHGSIIPREIFASSRRRRRNRGVSCARRHDAFASA
jgi:hypothetical protein